MKKFMIVADDFGQSSDINRGVRSAVRSGSVSSVSLMVEGGATSGALSVIEKYPKLVVGLHVDVDGLFVSDSAVWCGDGIERAVAEAENPAFLSRFTEACERQIEKFLALGFEPTIINSHNHVHTLPSLFPSFVALAKKHGFSYVRFSPSVRLLHHGAFPLTDETLRKMASLLESAGIGYSDWYINSVFHLRPPKLNSGMTEIVVHPKRLSVSVHYLDLLKAMVWMRYYRSSGFHESIPIGGSG
jgi:predicted glycoside hydrolase/deacetylase ChbG (UPF0249 family)